MIWLLLSTVDGRRCAGWRLWFNSKSSKSGFLLVAHTCQGCASTQKHAAPTDQVCISRKPAKIVNVQSHVGMQAVLRKRT